MNFKLLGIGNPLLDISANCEQDIFDKYDVKLNNAILAEEKHLPLYEELSTSYDVTYIAGGATQNSIRVAQWMMQEPNSTAFIGAVGDDNYANELRKSADKDGVKVFYMVSNSPTGTCACLIKDQERSLVANLSAANDYKIEHMKSEEVNNLINNVNQFYISGFFLTVSPPSVMHIAEHVLANPGKSLAMNLSAPFIMQFFWDPLMAAMPYVDLIFGNESECATFGEKAGYEEKEIADIALKIAKLPKKFEKSRVVIITCGADATVIVENEKVTLVPTPKIPKEEIVDSNGAGDAFVGGFMAAKSLNKPILDCVRAGQYASGVILRVSGTVLSGKPEFEL